MNMKLWKMMKNYQKEQLLSHLREQYYQKKINTSFYANNVTFCNIEKQGGITNAIKAN